MSRARVRCFVCFVGCSVWLVATEGWAQPVPMQPGPPPAVAPAPPPPPPPPPYAAGPLMNKKELHRYLLETDEEYASARGRRLGGILLASIGGGLGLVTGALAGMVYAICSVPTGHGTDGCEDARNWMIGGFVTMGVAVAVGIPLAVSGNSRMKEIRRQRTSGPYSAYVPQVNVSLSWRGGGQLGLRWAF